MNINLHSAKASIVGIALLISLHSHSQQPVKAPEERPYIEVTGRAENEVVPDEIYISIVIREKYVNKEKITIESQEEKLKNAVKGVGISLSNLYLSDANADYVRVRWRTKDVLTQKDYTLKVASATEVSEIFKQLDMLEIKDAYIARVNHSKIDSLKKDMRIQAIKGAKAKADYLLNAIGEEVGKPIFISESASSQAHETMGMNNIPGVRMIGEKYEDLIDPTSVIKFKKIMIEATVYVRFGIK